MDSQNKQREAGLLSNPSSSDGSDRSRRVRRQIFSIHAALCAGLLLFLGYCYRFDIVHRVRHVCSGHRGQQLTSIEARVDKILSETPLIDGHNDFPILIRFLYNNHIYDDKFKVPFEEGGLPMHVDLPRLKAGKSGGAFWSVFTPCPQNGTDFSDDNYIDGVRDTLQQIDLATRLKAAYPAIFSPSENSTTALSAFRDAHQFISPLGIEGLHQIGNSAANLRRFHGLGVRYATLTHNCHNIYADAAVLQDPDMRRAPPFWGGVSEAGRAMVREMNRMGMIVDLSHVAPWTMRDVLGAGSGGWAGSEAPIIFSHSGAYAVCPHPRNVPDDVLGLVKERGGVVMVNFSPGFVSCVEGDNDNGMPDFYPANSTLAHVAEHVLHIGRTAGFDHVGLGSDFDGIMDTPEGLDDVSKFPDLVAELLRRGVSDEDAAKVVGGNVLRVWGEVEKVALKMQAAGVPVLEDDLPNLLPPGMESEIERLQATIEDRYDISPPEPL